ncbi:MAG: hypothetical protein C0417_13255 [Chlorobiaceae bacterium]|nr:hypothetical protein [Chlorobiaceae bacterium]
MRKENMMVMGCINKLFRICLLIILSITYAMILFINVSCDKDNIDADRHGFLSYTLYNETEQAILYPIVGMKNKLTFKWRVPSDAGSWCTINLSVSNIERTYLYMSTTLNNLVLDETRDGEIIFDASSSNQSNRKFPLEPGNYTIKLQACSKPSENFIYEEVKPFDRNSWDYDGDGISDAVEDENGGINGVRNIIEYGAEFFDYDKNSTSDPPKISKTILSTNAWYTNREMHDYSLARGNWTSGSLVNGLRIANYGIGYQYWRGSDVADTDNWATLELINLFEKVARKWNASYPNYPIITSMDMSLQCGGPFIVNDITQHGSHQNGLDVDIRYIRTDNSSEPVDINNNTFYSRQRTQELINCFRQTGNVSLIFSADNNLDNITYDADHTNHLHIRILDPDGNN